MQRYIDREEVEEVCKTLAAIYCQRRDVLPKDDKFTLCRAHSILEDIAKTYECRGMTPEGIDIDLSEDLEIISDVAAQQSVFGGK